MTDFARFNETIATAWIHESLTRKSFFRDAPRVARTLRDAGVLDERGLLTPEACIAVDMELVESKLTARAEEEEARIEHDMKEIEARMKEQRERLRVLANVSTHNRILAAEGA